MKHILYCEDTPEGIFSAVHRAYRSRWGHSNIEIRARNGKEQELEFFTETEEVLTDRQHAESVRNALIRQIGSQAYDMIMDTALSDAADKADVIYHFLVSIHICLSCIILNEFFKMSDLICHIRSAFSDFFHFCLVSSNLYSETFCFRSFCCSICFDHFLCTQLLRQFIHEIIHNPSSQHTFTHPFRKKNIFRNCHAKYLNHFK